MMILPIIVILIVFAAFAMYVITHEKRKREAIISVLIIFVLLCVFGFTVYNSFFSVNTEGNGDKNNTQIKNTEISQNSSIKDDPEANKYEDDDKQKDDPDAPGNLSIEQYIEENLDCLNYSLDVDWNNYTVENGNQRVLGGIDSEFGITVSYF